MNEQRKKEYETFINTAWDKAVNHKEGEKIEDENFTLLTDTEGVSHTVKTQKVRHIYKKHGNDKAEKARNQTAITKDDFSLLPDIINNYSYMIRDFTYDDRKSVIYTKYTENGTRVQP